jgi:hypothetical protein
MSRAFCSTVAVINKELSVKTRVSEELVTRDLDLIMPSPEERVTLKSLYIHLTRIGVIQLELVAACLKFDENKYQQVRTELDPPTCRPLWV